MPELEEGDEVVATSRWRFGPLGGEHHIVEEGRRGVVTHVASSPAGCYVDIDFGLPETPRVRVGDHTYIRKAT